MNTPDSFESIDGFDPLAADDTLTGFSMTSVLEEASKRIVYNILKSYTGYYDVFSELLQNSLDAVQQRQEKEGPKYQPQIWVCLWISLPDWFVWLITASE